MVDRSSREAESKACEKTVLPEKMLDKTSFLHLSSISEYLCDQFVGFVRQAAGKSLKALALI